MADMAELDWYRFNAIITIRHSVKDLLEKNVLILNKLPYQIVVYQNPEPDQYVLQILTNHTEYDWVINVDDDCFLMDFKALYDLMVYMDENEYDLCGIPDGLTYTPRDIFNPTSLNPFFNVFRIKSLKNKCNSRETLLANYTPELLKNVNLSLYHPEIINKTKDTLQNYNFPGFDPYYPVFFAITQRAKILYLYGRSYFTTGNGKKIGLVFPEDWITTILYNHDNQIICHHTWYARMYYKEDNSVPIKNNRQRINKVLNNALKFHGISSD